MAQLEPIVQPSISSYPPYPVPANLFDKAQYSSRVYLKAYVKRTGKSQDYKVKHSHIGCVKCGKNGMCSSVKGRRDRNIIDYNSVGEYLAEHL